MPREAVEIARDRKTNILILSDVEKLGIEKTIEIALELAWKDTEMVYLSFNIDSVDCGFVPGTGWRELGGFLPREALQLLAGVAAEGLCGMELVEVSPPYDQSEITALMANRVIVEVLGSMTMAGSLGNHRKHIDKAVKIPSGDFEGHRCSINSSSK